MLVIGAAHIEETATQLVGRLRNSLFWQWSMPVFTRSITMLAIELPREFQEISCSVTRCSGSFCLLMWYEKLTKLQI
jgi:hypothetical protein